VSSVLAVARRLLTDEWARFQQSPLARNAGWLVLGQGANVVLQAIYFMTLGRLLGSSQYGIFIGAFALTSLIAMFSAMGSGTLFLRYVSIDHSKFSLYWGNILLTTGVVSGVLMAAVTLAAPHLVNSSSASIVWMAAIANCLCGEFTANVARVFQTFEKMKFCAIINSSISLVRVLAALGMLLSLHRATAYQWAMASMLVSCLAALVSLAAVTLLFGRPRFSLRLMTRGIAEGFGYSFGQSAATFYNEADKTMLSHYGMNQANGIYALAYRAIDMATIPVVAVRDASVPTLFRLGQSDLEATRRLTFRLLKRCVAISLLFAAVIYATAPLIPWIVGKSFTESILAVRWLCIIPVLRSLHHTTGSAIMGMGKYHYRLTNQVATAATNFCLNLWLIPAYGWRGAAAASVVADGMLGLLNLVVLLWLTRTGQPYLPGVDLPATK
jgi:O-antigen/teichoic acid export membrane protein